MCASWAPASDTDHVTRQKRNCGAYCDPEGHSAEQAFGRTISTTFWTIYWVLKNTPAKLCRESSNGEALRHATNSLVHAVFGTSWRTLAQSSPSTVPADNQCAVDFGIFVLRLQNLACKSLNSRIFQVLSHKTLEWSIPVNLFAENSAGIQGRGEKGDPREITLISAIVRHNSHLRRSAVNLPGNLFSGVRMSNVVRANSAAITVSLLASHQSDPGPFPLPGHSGFSHVGIVPDDAVRRRVFSGISLFSRPFIAALHTSITLIGSQDLDYMSRPNLFTHSFDLSTTRSRPDSGYDHIKRNRHDIFIVAYLSTLWCDIHSRSTLSEYVPARRRVKQASHDTR
ncbi:hypothetical protein PR048_024465 [Dryococelus australis]|uniref:Uncharacterized protein n=1 Tax=Dryococelus australis TaxID=614101 RepID=A0ABQ9GNP1_9NEOP|nr:hypothetical protein PR048_024465 [Dryococelus australis]